MSIVESFKVEAFGDLGSSVISDRHFGTVVTSNFGWQGADDPETSYAMENYLDLTSGEFQIGSRLDFALEAIGAKSLRYPGGTESWSTFEWKEEKQVPDETGLTSIEKLKKVIDYCALKGYGLEFTFPVRNLGGTPEELSDEIEYFFFTHLLGYAFEQGVAVNSIKIGNEYNVGAAGGNQISAESYGDTASDLVGIIGPILDNFQLQQDNEIRESRPELIIESGVLWRNGYADIGIDTDGDGRPEGNGIQDTFDIFSAFTIEEFRYVDGIDLHNLNLNVGLDEYYGLTGEDGSSDQLPLDDLIKSMINRWTTYTENYGELQDIDFHSLAWSLPRLGSMNNNGPEYAGLSILQLHTMSLNGLESAVSWQATGFTNNAFVQPAVLGQASSAGTITPWGQIHYHMANELTGFAALETIWEYGGSGVDAVAFSDGSTTKLYILNFGEASADLNVDLLDLQAAVLDNHSLGSSGSVKVSIYNPLPTDEPDPTTVIYKNMLGNSRPELGVELEAYEIVQVVIEESDGGLLDEDPSTLTIDTDMVDPTKLTVSKGYMVLEFEDIKFLFTDVDYISQDGVRRTLSDFAKQHHDIIEFEDVDYQSPGSEFWSMAKEDLFTLGDSVDYTAQVQAQAQAQAQAGQESVTSDQIVFDWSEFEL